jgi:hypothetical protein
LDQSLPHYWGRSLERPRRQIAGKTPRYRPIPRHCPNHHWVDCGSLACGKRELSRARATWKFQWPITRIGISPTSLSQTLYVGRFWADFKNMESNGFFSISMVLFNQAAQTINIEGVRGHIISIPISIVDPLPLPLAVPPQDHNGCTLTLRQTLTKDEVAQIREGLTNRRNAVFSFANVHFLIHQPEQQTEAIALHNFDGIGCQLTEEGDVKVSRVVSLTGRGRV